MSHVGATRRSSIATRASLRALAILVVLASCARSPGDGRPTITFSGSALGAEGEVNRRQVARFAALHPELHVVLRSAPDDATQRHQLYVQWLNAHAGEPDVLQLDVVWTPEFAAAGWILPLDGFHPDTGAFFPATLVPNRWAKALYALPWFVDVGLLYRRTDLVPRAPATLDELTAFARAGMSGPDAPPYGIVWQGARYEGLVTTFVEYLGAFGGEIVTPDLDVAVDSPAGVRALEFMVAELRDGLAPRDVLTWHEEEARFAFQNGSAVFMRNWPYAYALLADSARSRVAGRFAVSPMPAARGGHATAALGGSELAINRYTSDPGAAYALIAYLTAPEQMLERARVVGQYPPRRALYDDPRLARALSAPVADVRRAVESATPRPVLPIYTQLSELLQVQLHRALTRQTAPDAALHDAARQMRALIARTRIRDVARGATRGG